MNDTTFEEKVKQFQKLKEALGIRDRSEWEAINKRLSNSQQVTYKARLHSSEVFECYKYLMENDCTVEEALNILLTLSESDYDYMHITKEFLDEAKHNRYLDGSSAPASILKAADHSTLEKHKDMTKNKTLDRKGVGRTTTPSATLFKVKRDKDIHNRIEYLEDEVDILNHSLCNLTAESEEHKQEIDRLLEEVNLTPLSNKDKAIALRNRGINLKTIAERLGVSESTVKRYLK